MYAKKTNIFEPYYRRDAGHSAPGQQPASCPHEAKLAHSQRRRVDHGPDGSAHCLSGRASYFFLGPELYGHDPGIPGRAPDSPRW